MIPVQILEGGGTGGSSSFKHSSGSPNLRASGGAGGGGGVAFVPKGDATMNSGSSGYCGGGISHWAISANALQGSGGSNGGTSPYINDSSPLTVTYYCATGGGGVRGKGANGNSASGGNGGIGTSNDWVTYTGLWGTTGAWQVFGAGGGGGMLKTIKTPSTTTSGRGGLANNGMGDYALNTGTKSGYGSGGFTLLYSDQRLYLSGGAGGGEPNTGMGGGGGVSQGDQGDTGVGGQGGSGVVIIKITG